MKVVMINDCSFVGETILKFMPPNIQKCHIKRSRRLWDKTIGLVFKILRSKGDIYHIHYLLQDCYIGLRLGKRPVVGHAHGSDIRRYLDHPLWGKIVAYNLKHCDYIVVSTPDLLEKAKNFQENVQYVPNPVDTTLFYPKPCEPKSQKKRVLIAGASNWATKGIDIAIRALSKIRDEVEVSIIAYGKDFERTVSLALSLGLDLNILPKIPHDKINTYFWNADVVLDQFKAGTLGMITLEAIACGRPAITYVSSEYREHKDFPLKDVHTEEDIADAVLKADENLWRLEYDYLKKYHLPEVAVNRILRIYLEVLKHL